MKYDAFIMDLWAEVAYTSQLSEMVGMVIIEPKNPVCLVVSKSDGFDYLTL